ncbi:hypothetical protein Tco_0664763 [Tanacetum coccineum]
MSTLQFADTHNLVAFLAKSAKSEGFEQVVDFLNAHTIKPSTMDDEKYGLLALMLPLLERTFKTRSARVVSSKEASLGDQEDASKHGRKIDDIDKDAEITLVGENSREDMEDENVLGKQLKNGDEVVVEMKLLIKLVENRNKVPRPRQKAFEQELSESTPTISLQLPLQVKGQGSKDKGKAKMIELEKPLKKKDQIKFDEEEALRLQAKFDEKDRLAREKAQ